MEITHETALNDFREQIAYSIQAYKNHHIDANEVNNIVLGGLGGSGIGAQFAKNFYFDIADKSIDVISDYHLPAYCNKNTLLILASYSGETEETLSLFDEGLALGCKIVVLTSGGALANYAKENKLSLYIIPKGYQPRMALGFSLTYNLLILAELFGIKNVKDELKLAIADFKNANDWKLEAKRIFDYFESQYKDKFVIVCDRLSVALGTRFTQQIQENAKLEGFVQILPENNHNALETYYEKLNSNIVLLNCQVNERVNLRFEFLKDLILKNDINFIEIIFDGHVLSEIFKVVHILDWLSIFLSQKNGADNMKVENISNLKNYLTKN